MSEPRLEVADAVKHFWRTRLKQRDSDRDGTPEGDNRAAVVGGKQLDGFAALIRQRLSEIGVPEESILDGGRSNITLPGYFRPAKQWDVVVMQDHKLLAAIELKSLCGPSFGNNYNNRIEEAVGSSFDFWRAYRAGLFAKSPPPFVGYLLLLERAEGSTQPVDVVEKHFQTDDAFDDVSYAERCENSIRRLLREQLVTGACLVLSPRQKGLQGSYSEPAADMSCVGFIGRLLHHINVHT